MAVPLIKISDRPLTFRDLRAAHAGPVTVEITKSTRARVARGAKTVAKILQQGEPIYGVNTGFGKLAQTRIADEDLTDLQLNLLRSHAAGTGATLPAPIVRLILLLKIKSLSRGHSGIQVATLDMLAALINADLLPAIPRQGSVGASGDLAPLAHMSLVLLGEGKVLGTNGTMSGKTALDKAGLKPLVPGPKEGLALLNGTQVSTAIAIDGLFQAERNLSIGLLAGAMAVDAILGSDTPFDPRIHRLRGHPGQIDTAAVIRGLLKGSSIRASHVDCERVQDPYSFRCQPQVMGACLDLMRDGAHKLLIESNAVTDNPLVFNRDLEVLSGGNFHAEPVAFVADSLALAIAEIGALSERRTAAMIDSQISELPPFLTEDPGRNSGFMLAQVTSAALASENKAIAHPRSTDSLPTSANQEDHVSMATNAALRLAEMNRNTRCIVAIELLAAAQGIDFRIPLKTSAKLARAHAAIRARIPHWGRDRCFGDDLEKMNTLIDNGTFDRIGGNLFAYQE